MKHFPKNQNFCKICGSQLKKLTTSSVCMNCQESFIDDENYNENNGCPVEKESEENVEY